MPMEHMSVSMQYCCGTLTGWIKGTYTRWVSHLSGILWMNLCRTIPRRRICCHRNQHMGFKPFESVSNVLVLRIFLKDSRSNKRLDL